MARLPTTFRKSSEAVATFSFEDIASGLGVVEFLGITTGVFDTGAIDKYFLITATTPHSTASSTSRTTAGKTTVNFNSSAFNLQRTAKGTAFVSMGMGSTTETSHVAATVQKVAADDTVTTIGSLVSGSRFASTGEDSKMSFIELPLTETIIEQGDKLRLVIDLHQEGSNTSEFGHSPQNKTSEQGFIIPGTKNSTTLRLLMPFKLPV